jgi:uncharacterized membrane protein
MSNNLHAASLSLTTVFTFLALASIVLFIFYAVEWHSHLKDTPDDGSAATESNRQYRTRSRTEYSYAAAVLSLLFVLMSMHGGVFSRIY